MFNTYKTHTTAIRSGERRAIVANMHLTKLYNFHIFIRGNINSLPKVIVNMNDDTQEIDLNDYVNLAFNPNVGYVVSYYEIVGSETRLALSFKSFGISDINEFDIIIQNNDVNDIIAYAIIEGIETGGGSNAY